METKNHVHVYTDTVVPATCQEGGYTLHRCDCGYEYKDKFTRIGDHNFTVTEQQDATCTEGGKQQLRCAVCGLEKAEVLPAKGHSWSDWSTLRVPTCLDDGIETRVCSCCSKTDERVLKATGHKLTQPRKSKTKKGITEYLCENCGQIVEKKSTASKVKKAIALALTAAVVLAVLMSVIIPALAPFVHYGLGRLCIPLKAYSAAYWNLNHAEGLFDAEERLQAFRAEPDTVMRLGYTPDALWLNFPYFDNAERAEYFLSDPLGNLSTLNPFLRVEVAITTIRGENGEYIDYTRENWGYGVSSYFTSNGILVKEKRDKEDRVVKAVYEDGIGNRYVRKCKYDSCGNLTYEKVTCYDTDMPIIGSLIPKRIGIYEAEDFHVTYLPAIP